VLLPFAVRVVGLWFIAGCNHLTPGLLGSEGIKWNFTKFLIGRDGQVIKRFASLDKPASLAADIEHALETA
jgi:glutathione peroxidase